MVFFHQNEFESQWSQDYHDYQRTLALKVGRFVSWIAVVIIPVLMVVDRIATDYSDPGFMLVNNLWRAPAFVLALGFIILAQVSPQGGWPRPLLFLLGCFLVGMMYGMFAIHYLANSSESSNMFHGLMIVIVGASVLSGYGIRDYLGFCVIPPIAVALFLMPLEITLIPEGRYLMYILLASLLGGVISEMLYRERMSNFVSQKKIERNAMTDPLTGLYNRRAMDTHLKHHHARSHRHKSNYAVIMADIDQFKPINDQHGHEAGDEILKGVSERLLSTLRGEDLVARWGGEEFLVLLPDTGVDQAVVAANRIQKAMTQGPFSTGAVDLPVTISMGISDSHYADTIDGIIYYADRALYEAKNSGRNQFIKAKVKN